MNKHIITAIHTIAFGIGFLINGLLILEPEFFTLSTTLRVILIAVCSGIQLYTFPSLLVEAEDEETYPIEKKEEE